MAKFKLVNYILIVDDKKLLMTSNLLQEVERVKATFENNPINYEYVIENFGVKLLTRLYGDKAGKWEKVKGYSLWQKIF